MSFLKNIFVKKDDDIPEMHVNKNEPTPYWSKEHKCWMIPGQEEEKIKELQEMKKGPPRKSKQVEETPKPVPEGEPEGVNQLLMSRPSINRPGGAKRNTGVTNRYASIIDTTTTHVVNSEVTKVEEVVTSNNEEINKEEKVEEINIMKEETVTIKETIISSDHPNTFFIPNTNETLPEIEKTPTELEKTELKEQESTFNPEYLDRLRREIEEDYKGKIMEMEEFYMNQIDDLKDNLQMWEDNAEEEEQLMKEQLNKFIKENLELKLQNEKLQDEMNYKDKEIEQFQELLENYRKVIEETKDKNNFDSDDSKSKSDDFVYINSKLEKLEYDKLILNNDFLEAKREISNLILEKSYLELKLKEIENVLNQKKDALLTLEKKLVEQDGTLKKSKDLYEQEIKRNEEIISTNKNLLLNYNECISKINDFQRINETLKNEINTYKNINEELNKAIIKQNESILNANNLVLELKNELERINEENCKKIVNNEIIKELVDQVTQANEKIFHLEKDKKENQSELERIKLFARESLYKIPNLNNFLDGGEFCLVFKVIENEFTNWFNQIDLIVKEKEILSEELKNTKIEVDLVSNVCKKQVEEMKNQKLQTEKAEILNLEISNNHKDLTSMYENLYENYTKLQGELNEAQSEIQNLKGLVDDQSNKAELENQITILENKNTLLSEEIVNLAQSNTQIVTLENKNTLLTEQLTDVKSNMIQLEFNLEKLSQETLFMNDSIISELDKIVSLEVVEGDIAIEVTHMILYKIKQLSNIIETKRNEISLLISELNFYKEDNDRKERSIELLETQLSKSKQIISELNFYKEDNETKERSIALLETQLAKSNDLISKLNNTVETNKLADMNSIKEKAEIENLKSEIESLKAETESFKEKANKLKVLLDNTKLHYENGIEVIKTKNKSKLTEYQNIIEEYKNTKNSLQNQVEEILQENDKLKKTVNDYKNEEQNSKMEYEALINNLNIKSSQNEALIVELKAVINNESAKYQDLSDKYDSLLTSSKSVEKVNELQKKIQHLNEEKIILVQSHGLIVENMSKEIANLTEKLNDYRKEEINLNTEVIRETEPPKNPPKNQLGFLSRIIAPIFLTDKDINSIQNSK